MEDGNNNNDIKQNTHTSDYYRERGRVKYLEKLKFLSSEKGITKGFKALSLKNYVKVFGADRYKEVMDDYKIALKLNPDDYLTYLYMADLADKLDEKNKCFDEAIKRNPHASEPYLKKNI